MRKRSIVALLTAVLMLFSVVSLSSLALDEQEDLYSYSHETKWEAQQPADLQTSDSVELTEVVYRDKNGEVISSGKPATVELTYTISEDAQGDLQVQVPVGDFFYQVISMPGDTISFSIKMVNQSGTEYLYRPDSFQIAPEVVEDTFEGTQAFNGVLVPSYATCYRGLNGALKALGISKSKDCTDEVVYPALEERGYVGEGALSRYLVDYYNQDNLANYPNRVTDAEHLDDFDNATLSRIFNASISAMPECLETEPEIIDTHFNFCYNALLKVTYDGSAPGYENAIGASMRNENGERTVADQAFKSAFGTLASGAEAALENPIKLNIDGQFMGNSYIFYSFNFFVGFELQAAEPEIPTGIVTVNKVDAAEKPLSGAEFILYRSVTEEVPEGENAEPKTQELYYTGEGWEPDAEAAKVFTGETFVIEGLPYGDYCLREVTVPDGYQSTGEIAFTLEAPELTVQVVNHRKSTPVDPDPDPDPTPDPDPEPEPDPEPTEDIPDEEVPQGETPTPPTETVTPEEPVVDIPDEEVPQGSVPDTGSRELLILVCLLIGTGSVLIVLLRKKAHVK